MKHVSSSFRWLLLVLLATSLGTAQAQTNGGVGIGTTTPNGQFEVMAAGTSASTDQQSTGGQTNTVASSYWQSFTAGRGGALVQMAVYGGAGNSSGRIAAPALLEVFGGTGTGGTLLASQNFTLAGYIDNTTPTTVSFATPTTVVAGQVYTFRVSLVNPGPGVYGLASFCTNNCYGGGSMSVNGSYDANFQTTLGGSAPQSALLVKGGNVGIGTTPLATLHVGGANSTVRLDGLASGGTRMVTTAADGTLGSTAMPADAQTLSLSGQTLGISGGNSVTLPVSGDNLGNHMATTNLGLNGNWLSNAPGNANGLRIDNSGNAGLGVAVPTQALDVNGGILARSNSAISNQGAYLQWNRTNADGETWLLNQQGGGGANAGIRFGGVSTGNGVTEWGRFLNNGNLGIGTSSPGQKLEVNGNALINTNYDLLLRDANDGIGWYGSTGSGKVFTPINSFDGTVVYGYNGGMLGSKNGGNRTALYWNNGGQVGVGTTGPAASAVLDVASTTQGFLPPRLSQSQRDAIAGPAAGLTIYNTSTNKLNTWNGTRWDEALSTTEQPLQSGAAVTFGYTGAAQTYTVPAGVFSLNVDAAGAQGGQSFVGNAFGGPGGRAQATLNVTPGEVLTLYVGGAGSTAPSTATFGGAGYNGGGTGCECGGNKTGGGGGASDIRRSATVPSTNLADRLLVAAGGGGGGEYGGGGAGGGTTGDTGGGGPQPAPGGGTYINGTPGTGGTQSAGGSGGRSNTGGALGIGGSDVNSQNGGGGGGGYYGGGAGYRAGGGGGSSWVTPVGGNVAITGAYRYGNGSITITPGPAYAAPVLNGSNFTSVASTNGLLARGSDVIAQQGAYVQWNRSGFEGETWLLNQRGGGGGNAGIRFGKADQSNTITEWARFQDDGKLGIGTTNPIAPLHVRGSAPNTLANGSTSFFNQGGGFNAINNNSGTKNVTAYFEGGEVWVSGYIVAGNLNTTSDRRIKHVVGLSDRAADLALLNRLRITDYTYIDQVNNTPGIVKKVIAQEVEEVLPQAVSRSRQALPNVYEKATKLSYANGQLTVTMAKAHELPAAGGRMRFYTPTNQSLDPEVTVVDAHTVRFASSESYAAGLFVYGKYVDDFRSVDYDAIAMLNVSATQELARRVAALEAANTALKAQAAAAKAQAAQATATLETFEARLRRLEAAGERAQR